LRGWKPGSCCACEATGPLGLGDLWRRLDAEFAGRKASTVDITQFGCLDTAGALVLLRIMEAQAGFTGSERATPPS
jgi:hypothetical protein